MEQMEELQRFNYNAPNTFLNFEDLEDEDVGKVEAFFETERNYNEDTKHVTIDDGERDQEPNFFTPMKETPEKLQIEENPEATPSGFKLRKSISMGGLLLDPVDEVDDISHSMKNLQVSARTSARKRQSIRTHAMVTRSIGPLNLRSRSISRDYLDKLSQPKYRNNKSDQDPAPKYVSMAEAINQFQRKTPKRFHTNPAPDLLPKMQQPLQNTIPQSPALATKNRARTTTAISREQQEIQDFEEAKKFRIKANPVNLKIFSAPPQIKPPVVKKVTQFEPFKLTEPSKTKTTSTATKPESFIFHAKPVPKSMLQAPKPIFKSALHTNAVTPLVLKHRPRFEPVKAEVPVEKGPVKAGPTKPVPFSFDERNKELLKKREQLINEVLEEEKKAREFHAKPIPRCVFKSPHNKTVSTFLQKRQRSDTSINSTEAENHGFKARPAKVLHMKPFQPKKKELNYTMHFAEFQLNTEKRSKEREEFENQIREKELEMALLKQKRMEDVLRMEEHQRALMRKEMEYKAQPIRHYKELPPAATKKVTSPKSPRFSNLKSARQNENKENTHTNGL